MQIRNYYYKEADQTPVIVGMHTISVPAAWCIWRDQLCSYPDKTAFLDIPAGSDERIILLALPGSTYRRIMFSVSRQEIRNTGAIQALYDALLTIDPEISSMLEYFEIFMNRMILCKRASAFLGLKFELIINGSKIL